MAKLKRISILLKEHFTTHKIPFTASWFIYLIQYNVVYGTMHVSGETLPLKSRYYYKKEKSLQVELGGKRMERAESGKKWETGKKAPMNALKRGRGLAKSIKGPLEA